MSSSPVSTRSNSRVTGLSQSQHSPQHSRSTRTSPDLHARPLLPVSLMQGTLENENEKESRPLAAHEQTRALVRIIQCEVCSKPFNTPVTLPCGRALCRTCLPESHERAYSTWPGLPDRQRAITCPFEECGREHTMADCCIDVVLYKTMDSIAEMVARQTSLADGLRRNHTRVEPAGVVVSHEELVSRSQGRLVSLYLLAAAGHLPYHDEDLSSAADLDSEDDWRADDEVLASLSEVCHREMDCQVCYSLMLDPVTTSCGHTLCRRCLVRTLDHSNHCPVCRRMLLIAASLQSHPSNKTLGKLLDEVCAESTAARKEAFLSEEGSLMGDFDIPLFVVTLGFPGCPTFLRIFEPRYRLMLRRALEGNRTFGIVMYNSTGAPQGELGRSQFMQYGTLLRIENAQIMADGTSIIEARGVSRFKVMTSGVLDGYSVGRVERVEDIPLAEEEAIEARELALPPAEEDDIDGQIARMSTKDLLGLGMDFVLQMQGRSAPWLHENILSAYGGPPDDAALFPYWFASILPVEDHAKYQLLQTTSVRERLKVTARWVKAMENQRWYVWEAGDIDLED